MATLTPWSPFRALELAAGIARNGAGLGAYSPALDLLERDGKLLVRLDAPGLNKDDINVEIKDNRLVITGERRAEETREGDRYWHFERAHGAFRRVVALPRGVDQSTATATYENGVLEVALELPRKPQPVKIAVN